MSDGPYRSLPMRPAWRKVAEWLENENFDVHQVTDRLSKAVFTDFQRDVPTDAVNLIRSAFDAAEEQLFPDQQSHDLAHARRLLDGSSLGSLLVDCVSQALAEGKTGSDGLIDALSATVEDWEQRAAREVEEHYLRHKDSPDNLTTSVRDRFQEAIGRVSAADIARRVLGVSSSNASAPVRYKGLDDGVPLS